MTREAPWWKNATIYQIYPASYKDSNGDGIGDLQGILAQLDYIKSLGVDAIWICPHYDSPQYDMGYDVANYEAVYPPYGTVEDVEAIITASHHRGLRVLLDLVINHTSHEHSWFKESRLSKTSPKRGSCTYGALQNMMPTGLVTHQTIGVASLAAVPGSGMKLPRNIICIYLPHSSLI